MKLLNLAEETLEEFDSAGGVVHYMFFEIDTPTHDDHCLALASAIRKMTRRNPWPITREYLEAANMVRYPINADALWALKKRPVSHEVFFGEWFDHESKELVCPENIWFDDGTVKSNLRFRDLDRQTLGQGGAEVSELWRRKSRRSRAPCSPPSTASSSLGWNIGSSPCRSRKSVRRSTSSSGRRCAASPRGRKNRSS